MKRVQRHNAPVQVDEHVHTVTIHARRGLRVSGLHPLAPRECPPARRGAAMAMLHQRERQGENISASTCPLNHLERPREHIHAPNCSLH